MAPGMEAVSNAVSNTIAAVAWFAGAAIVIVIIYIFVKKRKDSQAYNIPVTIFIPRSDNKTRDIIHGTGGYFKSQAVGGITSFRLKRKGVGVIELPLQLQDS